MSEPTYEALHPDMETPDKTVGVRYFHVGAGFDLTAMRDELSEYMNIMLGRIEPPVDVGVMTLMEVAEVFHARAKEMEMEILDAEASGAVLKGSRAYKFRTGFLRSFIESASKSIDLGSRRITHEQYILREREGR